MSNPPRHDLTHSRFAIAVGIVCSHYGTQRAGLLGRVRTAEVAAARQALYVLLYTGFDTSYNQIGRLTKRDHTTVRYGVLEGLKRLESDTKYRRVISRLIGQTESVLTSLEAPNEKAA